MGISYLVWRYKLVWCGWGWQYPSYWGYYGETSADILYKQLVEEERGRPYYAIPAIQDTWLSLGAFALGQDTASAAYSNMLYQLAVNKDGMVGGSSYNTLSNQLYQIEGEVDRQNQEVSWQQSNDPSSPIMITPIFNLTQDVSPIKALFADGTEQDWVLVRVHQ